MAYQAVGIGSTANDGTGDQLRTAFTKVNANFVELYKGRANGTDIVAAATLDLSAATADFVDVTGNTGVTAVTLAAGESRTCRFTGTPTITAGASLILNTGAGNGTTYQVIAGDIVVFHGYAASVVRATIYPKDGFSPATTTAAKTLLDDASISAIRTTLGLGTAALVDTGTSGATVPLLNAANVFSLASNSNNIEIVSTVDNANAGPFHSIYRNRPAGAANDLVGGLRSQANNGSGTKTILGVIDGQMTDHTNASEDFIYRFQTVVNGALATRLNIGGGLYHASATGTDKGLNTINFGALYDDNVLLTCMALATEFRDSGTVDLAKWDAMVPNTEVPERVEQVPVMEEVEQSVLILERDDSGDLILRTEVRTALVEATYFDPVRDADGNGIDAIEMPLVEERVIPAQTIVREHHTARVFKAMLDGGFDPRDPEAYFAKMQSDEALPGMPTQADWVHNALSVGENFSRKWLAMEMLAIVCNAMWIKLLEHDARLDALEASRPRKNK
jgi:hypothetical protein